ncbi:MAG: twin-arginine translocation pathway signal protein [Pseudomonadota bacterium]
MTEMSRRKMLALVGGGTVLAASAGAATFLATRTPHAALAPWDAAGGYADPRLRALSYALLAPNPHNRQPWEAELVGEDAITIWRDPSRNLPVTDPFARQLTIGMGCFLELCRMAAAEEGFATEAELFPAGEGGPVAHLRLVSGGMADPLFAHVMERRSHKEMFADRAVTLQAAADLDGLADLHLEGASRDRLLEIAIAAWQVEAGTPAAWQESIDLLRIGRAEIEAQPDGIDVGGAMPEIGQRLGVYTRTDASDMDHPQTRAILEESLAIMRSAPALTVTRTTGNTRFDQIEAGRQWMRLNLAATGAGLGLRPVSQALQEYPEMATQYAAIHEEFAQPGETVQMLGLLGYCERTPRTPRWPLETRLRDA